MDHKSHCVGYKVDEFHDDTLWVKYKYSLKENKNISYVIGIR